MPAERHSEGHPGGGRKPLVETDTGLLDALLALVEPTTRGDPESALRWTCKSLRRLEAELRAQGHPISRTVIGELLKEQGFSLQANCKTREGDSHPDRDAQFGYINELVSTALAGQQPVISVDTKKKELVGDFKNGGREWQPKGQPEQVRVHDFLIKELGRAVPYGVNDLAADHGWGLTQPHLVTTLIDCTLPLYLHTTSPSPRRRRPRWGRSDRRDAGREDRCGPCLGVAVSATWQRHRDHPITTRSSILSMLPTADAKLQPSPVLHLRVVQQR
jgi:hypothetical protein